METSPEGSPGDGYQPLTDFCLSNNCPPLKKTPTLPETCWEKTSQTSC